MWSSTLESSRAMASISSSARRSRARRATCSTWSRSIISGILGNVKGPPLGEGPPVSIRAQKRLGEPHFRSLQSLRALRDLERHPLALLEALVTVLLDLREVDEDIVTLFPL